MTDTAPATGTDTTTTADTTTDTGDAGADLAAEVAKWKDLARKHEDRAKTNATAAKELEKLREQSMTDVEKAVNLARAEAKAEALREVGGRLVDAEVRAAAAGRPDDVVEALLDGLDRARFLDEDGEPDRKAIKAWVERIAPIPESGFPDLGQGVRTTSSNTALNGDPLLRDLKSKLGIS